MLRNDVNDVRRDPMSRLQPRRNSCLHKQMCVRLNEESKEHREHEMTFHKQATFQASKRWPSHTQPAESADLREAQADGASAITRKSVSGFRNMYARKCLP
jgi:hypothetical protein